MQMKADIYHTETTRFSSTMIETGSRWPFFHKNYSRALFAYYLATLSTEGSRVPASLAFLSLTTHVSSDRRKKETPISFDENWTNPKSLISEFPRIGEDPADTMSKQYTRGEVASSSNSKNQTLFIIHDKVYNVTSFLNEHPGGEEILVDHGGKDASEDFDDVGHSKDALDLMKKYLVGELVESERTGGKPKQTWTSDYSKDKQDKENQGLSPFVWVSVLAAVMAVVYFVYL